LFNEVLDSQFNAGLTQEVDEGLVPEILEVATFADRVRGVLPQSVQGFNQLDLRAGSAAGDREEVYAPVNVAEVDE